MRKIVLLLFIMSIFMAAKGQSNIEIKKDSFPIYQSIINVPGKTAKEIYPLIKSWIVTNFNSAKDVVQMDDPTNGKIILKAIKNFTFINGTEKEERLNYRLTFDIKDNKFRATVEFTDSWCSYGNIDNFSILVKKDCYKQYYVQAFYIKDTFFDSLSKLSEQKQDNW